MATPIHGQIGPKVDVRLPGKALDAVEAHPFSTRKMTRQGYIDTIRRLNKELADERAAHRGTQEHTRVAQERAVDFEKRAKAALEQLEVIKANHQLSHAEIARLEGQARQLRAYVSEIEAKKKRGGREAAKVIAQERSRRLAADTDAAEDRLERKLAQQQLQETARQLNQTKPYVDKWAAARDDVDRLKANEQRNAGTISQLMKQNKDLKSQLAGTQRALEKAKREGRDVSAYEQNMISIQQQLAQINVNINDIRTGRVVIDEDGVVRRRDGTVITYGHNAAGGLGAVDAAISAREINVDALRNAGVPEATIQSLVQDGARKGWRIIASKKEEKKEETVPPKATWDERFAAVGANLNKGVGMFANPGAFVNILLAIVIILLIWIVMRVFFPMVP